MKKLWVAVDKRGMPTFFDKEGDRWKALSFNYRDTYNTHTTETLARSLEETGSDWPKETDQISGAYFPRIWRGARTPSPQTLGPIATAQWVSTVRTTRMLYSKLAPLFAAIEPVAAQDNTYGLLQREILILACTEVESAWKSVLVENNADPRGKYWNTGDYVRLLPAMRLNEWTLSLSSHHAYRTISPFATWSPDSPTASLPWYEAYNAVKHGRELSIDQATFGHAVDAVAAAFIMTIAQFGHAHLATYQTESEEVAAAMHFHPDEFTIEKEPYFGVLERYLPPYERGIEIGEWLGHKKWTPTFCPTLDKNH